MELYSILLDKKDKFCPELRGQQNTTGWNDTGTIHHTVYSALLNWEREIKMYLITF